MSPENPIPTIPSVAKPCGLATFIGGYVKRYAAAFRAFATFHDEDVKTSIDCRQLAAENEVFINLMDMAKDIERRDATGLPRLVSAILRPLQAEQILSVAERTQHAALDAVRFDQLFSPDYFFSYFDPVDCLRVPPEDFVIDLSSAIVFATPWVRTGFASALAHIGSGKSCGSWRQDTNHGVTLLLPWRIAVVVGGNHLIAAGILGHEGILKPSSVLDLSPLLARVQCDGTCFRQMSSGAAVARMRNGRVGALFEIGRLMVYQKNDRIV